MNNRQVHQQTIEHEIDLEEYLSNSELQQSERGRDIEEVKQVKTADLYCEKHKQEKIKKYGDKEQVCQKCEREDQELKKKQIIQQNWEKIGEMKDLCDEVLKDNKKIINYKKSWEQKLIENVQQFQDQVNNILNKLVEQIVQQKQIEEEKQGNNREDVQLKIVNDRIKTLESQKVKINDLEYKFNNPREVALQVITKNIEEFKDIKTKVQQIKQQTDDQTKLLQLQLTNSLSLESVSQKIISSFNQIFQIQTNRKTTTQTPLPKLQTTRVSLKQIAKRASFKPQSTHKDSPSDQSQGQNPFMLSSCWNPSAIDNIEQELIPRGYSPKQDFSNLSKINYQKDSDRVSLFSQLDQFPDSNPMIIPEPALNNSPNHKPETIAEKSEQFSHNSSLDNIKLDEIETVYYLKPLSNLIYLLDFTMGKFVKQRLEMEGKLPYSFTSIQVPKGDIFIIGGIAENGKMKEHVMQITPTLEVLQKVKMKSQRFSIPLGLIKEKYILACGGTKDQKKKVVHSKVCDMFDTEKKKWISLNDLKKERSCTSLSVMQDRWVYIFSGQPDNNWNTFEVLDLGDKNVPAKGSSWKLLAVNTRDLVLSQGQGTFPISQTQILIFGSQHPKTYLLNPSNLNDPNGQDRESVTSSKALNIEQLRQSNLSCESKFCSDCDFIAKEINNVLYAIDGRLQKLHVFSLDHCQWLSESFEALGIK